MPLPLHATLKDGRTVQVENEHAVLKAVRHFGHLRRHEIAMAVWPQSPSRTAYVMAARTVSRMVREGFLVERRNTLGGVSVVLGTKGVETLMGLELAASEGYDLGFNGPQFFHRTLGTSYLLDRARTGDRVFGEYAILKGWAPISRDFVRTRFKKIPDGMIVYSGAHIGMSDGTTVADWLEVESAYKPYAEVHKALQLLNRDSQLTQSGDLLLHKLVFVYDGSQLHERRLLRYIVRFLKENPNLAPELVLDLIVMARCTLDIPLTWRGVEEFTALALLQQTPDIGDDIDLSTGGDSSDELDYQL